LPALEELESRNLLSGNVLSAASPTALQPGATPHANVFVNAVVTEQIHQLPGFDQGTTGQGAGLVPTNEPNLGPETNTPPLLGSDLAFQHLTFLAESTMAWKAPLFPSLTAGIGGAGDSGQPTTEVALGDRVWQDYDFSGDDSGADMPDGPEVVPEASS
jgi:hypothetical protein